METAKVSVQRRRQPRNMTRKGLGEFLPTSVQKSYFLLSTTARDVLNTALEKYRPGQSEPILIGGNNRLKPALQLIGYYRLVIEEIKDAEVITSYTRWVDAVQVRGTENPEVFLIFSPRFERIWVESKKRLLDHVAQNPRNIGLRSQYAIRLYSWAQKYVTAGTKRVSLEEVRKVLGLESVKDADGNVIQEAPLPVWANFRQRALDTAIAEIQQEDGFKHQTPVSGAIKASSGNHADFCDQGPGDIEE